MPTHLTKTEPDGTTTREPRDTATVTLPDAGIVIEITHDEVRLFDDQGKDIALIYKGDYPGAGMSVEVAERVRHSVTST